MKRESCASAQRRFGVGTAFGIPAPRRRRTDAWLRFHGRMPAIYAYDPFLWIQRTLAAAWLDVPMAALSVACEGWALALLAALVALGAERCWRRAAGVAVPAFASLASGGILTALLKRAFPMPRPLSVLGPEQVRVLLDPLRCCSFPSGHALSAGVLAAYFTARYGPRALPLWALALGGAVSRIYVGAHWAADVVGGLLLGAALGVAGAAVSRLVVARGAVARQAPASPAPISICVITRDEERHLPGLLAAIGGLADDLVIVDAGSRDATVALARGAGARVFHRDWVDYGTQRLFAVAQARHDLVLSLDADERPSAALVEAIRAEARRPEVERAAGYRIHFRHWALGRRVRFGQMWRDRRVRLFDRRRGGFDGAAVHEKVRVGGVVRDLPGRCDHLGCDSAAKVRTKLSRYARAAAEARFARGARFQAWHLLRWPLGFARRFVLRLGFLDGLVGLRLALLYARYDLEKALVLRSLAQAAGARAFPGRRQSPQGRSGLAGSHQ